MGATVLLPITVGLVGVMTLGMSSRANDRAALPPEDVPVRSTRDLVFIPGTLGTRPGSSELADGIEGQVRQTLDNIRDALAEEGLDLSDVVTSNVFLADTRLFPDMNRVYRTYFPNDPPTRATVEADLPLAGALVQIAVVAARRGVVKKIIEPAGLKTPDLPYSWGVQVGATLFVAGATSRNPDTYQPQGGDVGAQTRQALENIGAVLEGAGMAYRDVVSCKVFLEDARDFGAMNRAYASFFPDDPPARATVRAGLMNSVFDVEIQCVAFEDAPKAIVIADGARRSSAPYSPGIRVGEDLYLAGMLGRGSEGYGNIADQTRRTLENIAATLATAGLDFSDVVESYVYLTDIRHYNAMEEVYSEMVSGAPPRTVVGTPLMSADALVEIQMTARDR